VLLTTESLYRRKVAGIRSRLPELRHVILVSEGQAVLPGTEDYHRLMLSADDDFMVARTTPDDVALVHFTSGTTGRPKGAAHVHDAVVAHGISGKLALDLHPGDVYWCTADPGWVTGTSYGIIAPLVNGVTSIVDEADFDPERWYRILDEQQVSVFYTAPTAIRMLMKAGAELAKAREYPRLRFLASVGEPLNPEGVVWGEEAFGMPFHDNWWQTETGAIMIANFRTMEVRPGSMGRPFPGIEAGLVRRLGSRSVALVEEPGAEGEIALRPGWPSMFRGYLGDPERYAQAFRDGWYLTGDLARRDADG
jgi:acetyl-CoA synthetase